MGNNASDGSHDIYVDHAANERTFLAWIRTAFAIVAMIVALTLTRWL